MVSVAAMTLTAKLASFWLEKGETLLYPLQVRMCGHGCSPCEGSVALAFGDKHHTTEQNRTEHRRRMIASSYPGWAGAGFARRHL